MSHTNRFINSPSFVDLAFSVGQDALWQAVQPLGMDHPRNLVHIDPGETGLPQEDQDIRTSTLSFYDQRIDKLKVYQLPLLVAAVVMSVVA